MVSNGWRRTEDVSSETTARSLTFSTVSLEIDAWVALWTLPLGSIGQDQRVLQHAQAYLDGGAGFLNDMWRMMRHGTNN